MSPNTKTSLYGMVQKFGIAFDCSLSHSLVFMFNSDLCFTAGVFLNLA